MNLSAAKKLEEKRRMQDYFSHNVSYLLLKALKAEISLFIINSTVISTHLVYQSRFASLKGHPNDSEKKSGFI